LKDFIYEGCVGDRAIPSIFSEANTLAQIRSSVFPDLSGRNLEEEVKDSPENFSTFLQACNLLFLVTRNEQAAKKLQISGSSFVSEVYSTFFTPLEEFVNKFKSSKGEEKEIETSLAGLCVLVDDLKLSL